MLLAYLPSGLDRPTTVSAAAFSAVLFCIVRGLRY